MEVPDKVAVVLGKFADIMPDALTKELPYRHAINHKIELEPGARPPAKAPYKMSLRVSRTTQTIE